ncbi:MAG TPA: hypothetical protein VKM94_01385 [Blastocatellia bacterium]|nr:hypothetical protein [Blastocatellia bacterium]
MKAKHHFISSAITGGALYYATGSATALIGTLVGGFLIDSDHVIDQLWSDRIRTRMSSSSVDRAAPINDVGESESVIKRYTKRRKLLRLPLVFHSYELLAVLLALTLILRSSFLIGLVCGYALHLILDLLRHHHEFQSPWFYVFTYRLGKRFRRDLLIKPEFF